MYLSQEIDLDDEDESLPGSLAIGYHNSLRKSAISQLPINTF